MLRHRDKGYSRSIFSRGDQCICSLRLPICWGTSSRVSWRWPWGYCACRKQKWHASKVHWFWLSASFPPQTRSSSIKRPSADFLLTSFLTLTFPQMGATYVTLMKFLVSSTDGFVGGNLHLSRTPGSRTWGKKSVLLLSLDQSPQLDSLLIHCDRGRLEFSIIPNFPNCRPDCSVMLILWTCWNPFYERRDDICGCVSFSTSFSKRSAHFFYESAKLQTLLWNCDKLKNDSEVPIPDFSNIQNHALVGACGRRE